MDMEEKNEQTIKNIEETETEIKKQDDFNGEFHEHDKLS